MSFRSHVICAAATVAVVAGPALAENGRHHHQARHRFATAGRAIDGGYSFDGAPLAHRAYGGYYGAAGWEAAVNAQRTAQAYREPGLTLELAPDSKQTATGGPSGGVPGFSGH